MTPVIRNEILTLLQPFAKKELTETDLMPLLLTLPSEPPMLSSSRRRSNGRSGRHYVNKAARTALKSAGIPTIRMHAWGQFYVRIGYRRSLSGARQRAFFYLGRDEKTAVAKAAALKFAWKELKRQKGCDAVWTDNAASFLDRSLQHLTEAEAAVAVERHHTDMAAHALEQGSVTVFSRDPVNGRVTQMDPDPSDNVVEQSPRLRIEQVRDMYIEYRKGKRGIGGGQGINEKTFTNECRNLKGGLASLDPSTLMNTLGYAEIERLRDNIFRRVNNGTSGITKRTANNYWLEVQRLLNWAHRQANVNYRHPEDVEDIFKQRFRNPNPVKIAEYDANQLKMLLAKASDRQRLYTYLALNCGHYQIDIGTLRRDEVVEYEGRTAIKRKRSKTAQQNDFDALHVLWPETGALLKREMARSRECAARKTDLALLSARGTPLYRKSPKCDIIGDSYLALQQTAKVDLPFKQFRKIGATAMQRLGGDETRRLYKAGTIGDGDKVYVREAWEKLTPHLMAWGEALRRDGVLFDQRPKAIK